MKRLALVKAAIDFSFANYQAGAVELAEKSIAAFKAAGGQDADLQIWNVAVAQRVAEAQQLARQKLPSEIEIGRPTVAMPVSNATAAASAPAA